LRTLTNEFKLLLETSQVSPSMQTILDLLKEKIHTDKLFSLAQANGTLPLLCRYLQELQEVSFHKDFSDENLHIKSINFYMSAQLLQLVFLLKAKEIEIIPIKGPLLSQHAYKDITLRPFSDLDILVQEKDLMEVTSTLLSLGYECQMDINAFTHPYILKKFTDISFVHPQSQLIVELHWKLLKTASSILADTTALFQNCISIPFQNTHLNSLALEEEFLYLCIHASKHRWERIEWMNDINYLFEQHQHQYNWDKLLKMAKDENALSSYLLGILILNKLYKRTIGHSLTSELSQNKKIKKVYLKVIELHMNDYILQEKKSGIRWMEVFFAIRLEDSFFKKLFIFKSVFFPLHITDILLMPSLPKKLRFLYYLKPLQRRFKKEPS